jgi:hypothetical protein
MVRLSVPGLFGKETAGTKCQAGQRLRALKQSVT